MNPRLFAIAGPLEGAFFALPQMDITIGSDPSCLIAIEDDSIAPRHCVIRWQDGRYRICKCEDRALTSVNALPVTERDLVHGDEIRVGECLFLFLTFQSETPWEVRLQSGLERLELENRKLQAAINLDHNMVGESAVMKSVFQSIARSAPSDSTVLVRGESGTGKELVARAVHRNSKRCCKPFVAINCAAISEHLLESELFGHERGAFTGAIAMKRGKLEMAEGGTVLLDEIGEMAPPLQAKLLRVLQEREFERVGGTRTMPADIRVLAATNRDLMDGVQKGTFRQDLYYRLNVVSITVPPLRERREDIPVLAEYFAAKFMKRCGRPLAGISPEAHRALLAHSWPGNVRELENAIERAVVLGANSRILADDLPESVLEAKNPGAPTLMPYHEAVSRAKREIILRTLRECNGAYAEAARVLGLHPNNLHRLIRNLDLKLELENTLAREAAAAR
jgi:transcriptional regulator with GAF, ATPase, and Fis domain